MAMIDTSIPKFLKRGRDGSLPPIKKAKEKASAAVAPKPMAKEPDPYMAVLARQDPVVRAAIEAEMKAHRFPRHWLLEPDTVALFSLSLEERKVKKEEALVRLRALKGLVEPRPPRPTFGVGVVVKSVAPNSRKPGTSAHARYDDMAAYVAKNKKATVADVLSNTAYRRDDFNWDLERGSIKTDILKIGKDSK
jgi:hypothetical protein